MKLIIKKGLMLSLLLLILNPLFLLADIEIQTANSTVLKDSENIIINKYQVVDNFIASSTGTMLEVCSCSQYKDTIRLYNTGTIPNRYAIRTSKDYAVPSEPVVALQPGEEKEISIFIEAPCTKGTQSIEYIITSTTQKTKVIEKNLLLGYCSSFALNPVVDSFSSEPCDLQVFEAQVFNIGNFKDEYLISTDSFENDIRLSDDSLSISPNSNSSLFIYFEPDCSVYGTNNITLIARSKKTGLESNIPLVSNIQRAYGYDVKLPQEISQCNMRYEEKQISITNKAELRNTYEIKLEGPEWVSLSQKEITLNSSETKTIGLILAPILEDIQDETVNVTVKSVLGDIEKEYEIRIDMQDCYSYQIQNPYDGPLLLCSDDKGIDFQIHNEGSKGNFYTLNPYSEKKGFLSFLNIFTEDQNIIKNISEDNLFVGPQEIRSVNLDLDLADEKARYDLYLNAQTFSHAFNQTGKQAISVITTQECYNVETDLASRYEFNRSPNSIAINISSNAFKPALYKLDVPDAPWVSIDKNLVYLEPKGNEIVIITFNPGMTVPDGTYELDLELSLEGKFYTSQDFKVEIINQTFLQKIKEKIEDFRESRELEKIEKEKYDFEIIPQSDKALLFCSDDNEISFRIRNKGTENNIYDVSAKSEKKGFGAIDLGDEESIIDSIRYPSMYVENSSDKRVYIDIEAPDKNSNYEIEMSAQTFSEEYNRSAIQEVSVVSKQDCYKAKTSLDSRYTVNRAENYSILATIENTGLKEADYDLSIAGFEWIALDKENFSLEPSQKETFRIIINPGQEVPDDTYQISLQISSEDKFWEIKNFKVKVMTRSVWEKMFNFITSFNSNNINQSEIMEDHEEINQTVTDNILSNDSGIQDIEDPSDQSNLLIDNTDQNSSKDEQVLLRQKSSMDIYEVCVIYNESEAVDEYTKESVIEISEEYTLSDIEELCAQDLINPSINESIDDGNESLISDNALVNMSMNPIGDLNQNGSNGSIMPEIVSDDMDEFAKKAGFILIGVLICLIIILASYIIFVLVRSNVNDDGYYYPDDLVNETKSKPKKPSRKAKK